MKKLGEILESLDYSLIQGVLETPVHSIQTDSRKVKEGDCFVAIKGFTVDGHDFIESAIEKGCSSIIATNLVKSESDITIVHIPNASEILGLIAANYYDHPSNSLTVCGVTGTNGKTTCTYLMYQLFMDLGYKVGLISTIEVRIGEKTFPSSLTTPDALSLQRILNQMVEEKCEFVFMEVSSHAIHQNRIAGVKFKVGTFTNITHDHLDYHKDFKEYIQVKKMFFDKLDESSVAVTNIDDKNGAVMIQNTNATRKAYALKKLADYKGKLIEQTLEGLYMSVNHIDAYYKLCGEYNAYNILAVIATAEALGIKVQDSIPKITNLNTAEGRLEKLTSDRNNKTAFVDYAHTPDALENVISTLTKMRKLGQRIITVVGCGGDRDKTKRPIMAKTAAMHSDIAIFTSDNPRTENPDAILEDMKGGVRKEWEEKVLYITDRKQAIKTAVMMANGNDIILVAGKGHEKYMDINGVKIPFDDKEILKDILNVY